MENLLSVFAPTSGPRNVPLAQAVADIQYTRTGPA
jgi:hypothetical protein